MQLIRMVCKKLAKNKSPETIAEDLEEELGTITEICKAAESVPDHDCIQIYKMLYGKEYFTIPHKDSPKKRKYHNT